jgi:hypothetical protein
MAEFFGDFHVILRLNNAGKLGSTFRRQSRVTVLDQPQSLTSSYQIMELNPTKRGLQAGTHKAGSRRPEIFHTQTMSQGSIRSDGQAMDDSAITDTTTESSFEKFNDGNCSLRWI